MDSCHQPTNSNEVRNSRTPSTRVMTIPMSPRVMNYPHSCWCIHCTSLLSPTASIGRSANQDQTLTNALIYLSFFLQLKRRSRCGRSPCSTPANQAIHVCATTRRDVGIHVDSSSSSEHHDGSRNHAPHRSRGSNRVVRRRYGHQLILLLRHLHWHCIQLLLVLELLCRPWMGSE